jgi:major intracellular serine protease
MMYLIYTMLLTLPAWAGSYPRVSSKIPGEIRVMIVDTGVGSNTKLDLFIERNDSEDYVDTNGHGTHIAGLIALGPHQNDPICKEVKIYSCKFYSDTSSNSVNLDRTIDCAKRALSMNIDLVNYSAGGAESSPEEYEAYTNLVNSGTIIDVAAGNGRNGRGENLKWAKYYPANYALKKFNDLGPLNHMNVIQNMCQDGKLCPSSNYYEGLRSEFGDEVLSTLPNNKMGKMTGTSQSTAIFTHNILMQKCNELKKGIYVKPIN